MSDVLPLKETGEVHNQSDSIIKLEMLQMPAITCDFMLNRQTEIIHTLMHKFLTDVMGICILSGFGITYNTGSPGTVVLDSVGEALFGRFYINKNGVTQWTHLTGGTREVFVKITVKREQYSDAPTEVGVTHPTTGDEYSGANQYKYTVAYIYSDSTPTTLGTIAGTGADGYFDRTAGTWTIDAEIGKEVEFEDSDGNMIGRFVVTDNTTTRLYVNGDVSDSATVRTDYCYKIGEVTAGGVVTESNFTIGNLANTAVLRDGSRSLLDDLAVASGKKIDGVDISADLPRLASNNVFTGINEFDSEVQCDGILDVNSTADFASTVTLNDDVTVASGKKIDNIDLSTMGIWIYSDDYQATSATDNAAAGFVEYQEDGPDATVKIRKAWRKLANIDKITLAYEWWKQAGTAGGAITLHVSTLNTSHSIGSTGGWFSNAISLDVSSISDDTIVEIKVEMYGWASELLKMRKVCIYGTYE